MSGGGKLEESLNNARKKIVKKYMRVKRHEQKNNARDGSSDTMLAEGSEVENITPSSDVIPDSVVSKSVMYKKKEDEKTETVIPSWYKPSKKYKHAEREADSDGIAILAEGCRGVESALAEFEEAADAAENKPKQKREKGGVRASVLKPIKFIPFNPNVTYQYWDDPNEICARLKLLVSSQNAGNTNHTQEIDSILEELSERGLIS